MNKKILVIQGHPSPNSYCFALAKTYQAAAIASGAEVREIVVNDLEFNLNPPEFRHREIPSMESSLLKAQGEVEWAEHLVFVYPNWWGTMPTVMKGFIDCIFTSGFAFKYRQNSMGWDQLLRGKSARLIVTMDTPPWYYRFINGQPGHRAMKNTILEFCGIKPVKITSIGSVRSSNLVARQKWLKQVEILGQKNL